MSAGKVVEAATTLATPSHRRDAMLFCNKIPADGETLIG
jgi:hypothetical protein